MGRCRRSRWRTSPPACGRSTSSRTTRTRTSAARRCCCATSCGGAWIWPTTPRRSSGSLQRTIDLYELDTDAFRAYKDRLIEYLERFIKDLTGIGGEIAELLDGLDPDRVDRLLALVAQRDAEDVAPGAGAAEDFREQAFAGELTTWQERWAGLQQWFISSSEHPSQAKLLRARARKAIPDLLAVVALLNERRAGRSDRTADFRELAVWFAQAPDEPAMHRVWQATFGLHSSRHLTIDADAARHGRTSESLPARRGVRRRD